MTNVPIFVEVEQADDGQRIERWLKKNAPHIPYALLQKLFRKGAIKVDGKKVKPSHKVKAGEKVRIPEVEHRENSTENGERKRGSKEEAEKYLLNNILYRDKKLVAINKPAGLAAQGGSGVKVSVDDLLPYLDNPPPNLPPQAGGGIKAGEFKLVHRIDKDTSGVMIVANGRENAKTMGDRFRDKDIEKIYWAIVVGVPDELEGKIMLPLSSKKSDGKIEKAVVDKEEGKRAVTHYRVIETAARQLCWVELRPITGRMHQLRVHMNEIGHPILGDGKYGGKKAFIHGLSNSMHLHAREITLPGYFQGSGARDQVSGRKGKDLKITADLPPHMQRTFKLFEFEIART